MKEQTASDDYASRDCLSETKLNRYSRKEFLRLFWHGNAASDRHVFPPYRSLTPGRDELCRSCPGHCATACPEGIIIKKNKEKPYLNVSNGGCTFCEACAEACQPEVLVKSAPAEIQGRIVLDQGKCLAWNGTICQNCLDACEDQALEFDVLFNPVVLEDRCTQCGFCVRPCPVEALVLTPVQPTEKKPAAGAVEY
ncbi:MAG: hypothetical protein GXO92_05295 [FCB group bacterium]|nr:hypothetical protein [FCB group bacterium]